MRPRHQLLLLARNETEAGHWRLVLETRGPFCVTCATELAEALEYLRGMFDLRAVLTTIPGELGAEVLKAHVPPGVSVLLFDVGNAVITAADRLEPSGPVLAERVLGTVKMMAQRKRGPHKMLPLKVPQLYRQLAIERDGVPT